AIRSVEGITLDGNKMEAGSNYFKVPLLYPQLFQLPDALRPSLQLEFSYTQPRSDTKNCSIYSFVAEFTLSEPETKILCLTPLETASDKLSALVWRVIKRNRQDENDDPAMIRHLHDLCKLQTEIRDAEATFIELALMAFEVDMNTWKRRLDKNLYQAALRALSVLREDVEYISEYQRFVASMSYADDSENIEFDEAIKQFEGIVGLFQSHS
ncbi:MAG: nucleotidyl transferase AbiEii/AbiGii toxin family protein, partial [Gammaproteobacteria bacterium]